MTEIGEHAFELCTGLSSIEIPDSVTGLGKSAFYSCSGLKEITIPAGIENIGEDTFAYCESLEKISLTEGLITIGAAAFEGCEKLTSLEIPSSIENIEPYAIYDCGNIKAVKIPRGVKTIGEYAIGFYYDDLTYKRTVVDGFVIYATKGSAAETYAINNGITFVELKEVCSHSQGTWIVDKNSTCTEQGSKHKECNYCGETVEAAVIDKKEHSSSDWILDRDATCTAVGFGHKECSVCKEVLETEEIAMKGHTSSNWKTEKKATVNSDGKKYKECTECGEVLETAKIPQLNCSKPKLKSIENTEYGVLTKWSKVSGADKYYVYRKTGSGGKYSRIGSTTKTYYTDKEAKSGKKYYYIVKAINEAGSSDSSSSKSILHLADTTLSTPKSTKSGITLKWKKVTGADGYMVYRKTGSGSYSKIATVKGNSKVTYTDKSAKKGKKYTYKIKAYKSKTCSAYSNTKTIKDKY